MANNNIYLAGKISKRDWRHAIFKELSNCYFDTENEDMDSQHKRILSQDGFIYSGPHFLRDDHGSFHGTGTHGRGAGKKRGNSFYEDVQPERNHVVVNKCFDWIKESDMLFVWLDSEDAYGTIVELGYAKALNKPIFLAISNELDSGFDKDIWFAKTMCDDVIYSDNPLNAWNDFVKIRNKKENDLFSYINDKKKITYLRTKTSEWGNIVTREKTVEEINSFSRKSLVEEMWKFNQLNYKFEEKYRSELRKDLEIEIDYKLVRGYLKNKFGYSNDKLQGWSIEGTGLVYKYPINYEREEEARESKTNLALRNNPIISLATTPQIEYLEVLLRHIGFQLNQLAYDKMNVLEASNLIGTLKTDVKRKDIAEDYGHFFIKQPYRYNKKETVAKIKEKLGKPFGHSLHNYMINDMNALHNHTFSDGSYFTTKWVKKIVEELMTDESYEEWKQLAKKNK